MKIRVPAKVNLFLDVLGKRKDGYHEVETIFQTVSLFDTVEIKKVDRNKEHLSQNGNISIRVHDRRNLQERRKSECPADHRNIVWRAAAMYLQNVPAPYFYQITLVKRIPVQAGVGGGSSDAAATLVSMARESGNGMAKLNGDAGRNRLLKNLAGQLGGDVPFFLSGGCALARGIGEKIYPIRPTPEFWAVIVKPVMGLSTEKVYRWLDEDQAKIKKVQNGKKSSELTNRQKLNKMKYSLINNQGIEEWSRHLYNRFESVVFPRVPELEQIKQFLIRQGAMNAILSGSGSAVFGIVGSKSEGESIKRKFNNFRGNIWVVRSV